MITKTGTGKAHHHDTQRLARVRRADLHLSMYEAILEALTTGVDVAVLDEVSNWNVDSHQLHVRTSLPARMDRLERLSAQCRSEGERLIARSGCEEDDGVAESLLKQARAKFAEAKHYEAELGSLRAEQPTESARIAQEAELLLPVEALVKAISVLARPNHSSAPRPVVEGLRTVLHDFRMEPDGDHVSWSTHLLLPAVDGRVLQIGPITGIVDMAVSNRPGSKDSPALEALQKAKPPTRARRAKGKLLEAGVPRELARILGVHPLTQPLDLVLRGLGLEKGAPPPGWDDPAWIGHLLSAYTDVSSDWHVNTVTRASAFVQPLADKVRALGGRARVADIISESDSLLVRSLITSSHATGRFQPLLILGPIPAGRFLHRDREVGLRACPHCGDWVDRYLRFPEITSAVLCSSCLRMPFEGSPTVPADYLTISTAAPEELKAELQPGLATETTFKDEFGLWTQRSGEPGTHRPPRRQEQILQLPVLLRPQGGTAGDVATALEMTAGACRSLMLRLYGAGLVARLQLPNEVRYRRMLS